jgi:hypothetical protein
MSGARGGEYDLVRNTLKELEMGAISPEVAKKRVWDLEGVVIEAGNNSEDSLEERKKDAHDFVFHIFHKMAVRGANDSEYGVVTAVLKKLDANEILPEEAKKIIWDTENNKQDWR